MANRTKKTEEKALSQNQNEKGFLVQTKIEDFVNFDANTQRNQTKNEDSEVDEKPSKKRRKKGERVKEEVKNLNDKEINVVAKKELNSQEETKREENKQEEIIDEKAQQNKIDEVEQSVSKQNSKKSKIINLLFFILNIAVVAGILIYQLSKEDFVPITGLRLNLVALIIIIALFVAQLLCECSSVSYLLKVSTGRWRFATAYKVTEIGKYYDAVTPMATGGQAFQVTYLKNRGVPLHNSLSIPLAKYVFGQIAWVVISFISLIISFTDKSYGTFVSVMSIIGFVLSFLVLSVTLFLCVCKTVGKKIVVKVLKLLHKMKIVKDYDKQYEKITKYISDFQDVMKQYAKSPKDFLILTFLNLAKVFLNYSIPFFVVNLFVPGLEGELFLRLMVMSVLVDLSSSFFPMPGGTGLNEISFTAAFGSVVGQQSILVWVLLLWRFCSYYFYLLQGVCILSYDVALGNKKYKWQVRKENLAEESAAFKQAQIDKFRRDRLKRRKNTQKSNKEIKEFL